MGLVIDGHDVKGLALGGNAFEFKPIGPTLFVSPWKLAGISAAIKIEHNGNATLIVFQNIDLSSYIGKHVIFTYFYYNPSTYQAGFYISDEVTLQMNTEVLNLASDNTQRNLIDISNGKIALNADDFANGASLDGIVCFISVIYKENTSD